MSSVKVVAGEFLKGQASCSFGSLVLRTEKKYLTGESISLRDIEAVEIASEGSVKKLGGAVGWGAAGSVILGPVGLLAGLLLGGKKKEVTFVAKFKCGRKLLATTDNKTFTKIQAAAF